MFLGGIWTGSYEVKRSKFSQTRRTKPLCVWCQPVCVKCFELLCSVFSHFRQRKSATFSKCVTWFRIKSEELPDIETVCKTDHSRWPVWKSSTWAHRSHFVLSPNMSLCHIGEDTASPAIINIYRTCMQSSQAVNYIVRFCFSSPISQPALSFYIIIYN